jgi:hypothetical protein
MIYSNDEIQEFNQYVQDLCVPRTKETCVEFLRELGAKECLTLSEIPSFYYDLLISLEIMYVPNPDEKRNAMAKTKTINEAKKQLVQQFIDNHF